MTDVIDREGLRKIVLRASGLSEDTSVVWAPDSEPFVSPNDRARVVLDVFSLAGNGWDEKRRTLSDGTDGYVAGSWVVTLVGNRTVIINVRAEAFDKGVEAAEVIDRIRLSLVDDGFNAQLDAIRLAYSTSTAAIRLRYVVDERVVNCAVADVTLLAIAQRTIGVTPDGQGTTYVSTINGNNEPTGTLTP